MTEYYVYRYVCANDGSIGEWVLPSTDPEPTKCRDDTSHDIDPTSLTVIRTIKDNVVTIKEEDIETGGHFSAFTIKVNALKNATSSKSISFPFPISALSLTFVPNAVNKGDTMDLVAGEDTIIGNLTADFTAGINSWASQNYVAGDTVTFVHPIFGTRVYTCIQDTVSNENPTNVQYWHHGLELNVSQTVIQYIALGNYVKLDDFINSDSVERVIGVDKVNNKIYVEGNPTNSYSAATPTYVRMSKYLLKDYEIGEPWSNVIGENKIGGSYIPKDTIIKCYYHNISTDTDKELLGMVEYLY